MCLTCKETLPLSEFFTANGTFGRKSYCKVCDRIRVHIMQRTLRARITRPDGRISEVSRVSGSVATARRNGWPIEFYTKQQDKGTTRPALKPPLHPELIRIRAEQKTLYAAADKKEAAAKDGFVYIAYDDRDPGWVKIGHSRDPYKRIASANTWSRLDHIKLRHMVYCEDRAAVEKAIHQELAGHRYFKKEWFDVRPDAALALLQSIQFGMEFPA